MSGAYDATGCTQGPPGKRRRSPGVLTTMTLDDATLVAAAATPVAADWLREDKPGNVGDGDGQKGGSPGSGPIPKPPSSTAIATTWEQVRELAMTRPLRELRLTASRPPAAATLATLAQPLGANSLALSVTFSGELAQGWWACRFRRQRSQADQSHQATGRRPDAVQLGR